MLFLDKYYKVGCKYFKTLSFEKIGYEYLSIKKLTSKGITGGLLNLFVTDPLKSYKYHSFIPKNKFYITIKYYVVEDRVTV
jgi:hypothetical protein